MSMSDVMLQNLMPRNFLDSDDDADTWSLGGGRSSGSSSQSGDSGSLGSPTSFSSLRLGSTENQPNFNLFGDYFGLSNLLNNVKITDDNPLLYSAQKSIALLQGQKVRRPSWGSDVSDAVISPGVENAREKYSFDSNNPLMNEINRDLDAADPGYKALPPPSLRYISKAMRDHIISGAYQQNFSTNRSTNTSSAPAQEKFFQPPPLPPMQPPPQSTPMQPPVQPPVSHAPPPLPPMNTAPAPIVPPMPSRTATHPSGHPGMCCVFCRNNKEDESVYTSHVLKDSEGRTVCPILRAYTCPICKANGDNSHTIKYCPENQNARFMQLGGQHAPHFQPHQLRAAAAAGIPNRPISNPMLPTPSQMNSYTQHNAASTRMR